MPTKSTEPDWGRTTDPYKGPQDFGGTKANAKESTPGSPSEDASTPGTPTRLTSVDEFECGQLFLAGTSEDFEGHLLFKTKTDYSFAGHITRAFSESPVRIEVDLNRSSYIRVVANTKLFKGDLIWVCRTLQPSGGGSDSDTSAVSTPVYPKRKVNSVKRKLSDRSGGSSRSSDKKRQTVGNRGGSSSSTYKDNKKAMRVSRKLKLSNVEVKTAKRSLGDRERAQVTPVKASLDVTKLGPVVDMNLSAKKRARHSGKKAMSSAVARRQGKAGGPISKKEKKASVGAPATVSKDSGVSVRDDKQGASKSVPSRKPRSSRPKTAEDDHIPRELEDFMVGDDEVEEIDLDDDEEYVDVLVRSPLHSECVEFVRIPSI
ncbi:hypothetical protein FOZ63_018961 [Perkinsus olseni]|uniref:Uncharacterized protein n=1 Tax=Perkinsus olseni TaxID=32597 RepID=A0A7J6N176_PEROL|nr:hypothetical protein FOZ62_013160 [Perkinsus olseni]KAF4680531.1 hypothetical protein FOZ60_013282 [Perkinsus olseni]KAF4726375.1 hypothetical protein FOZ63_018961 [Perkinsus olseni]